MTRITVVTTPSDSYNLVTLAQAKQALQIDTETTTYDALIRQLIARASDTFARACDRVFALEEVTDTFRSTSCFDVLRLSHYPVVEITDVTINGSTLDETGYFVDATKGLIYLEGLGVSYRWPQASWQRYGSAVVNYSGGFVLPGGEEPEGSLLLPADVTAAVLALISLNYLDITSARDSDLRSEDIPGVISQTFASSSTTTSSEAFPATVSDAIARYRVPVIA